MNEICLLNDSYPPLIDGVANVVVNYAKILTEKNIGVSVVTPMNPDADDSGWSWPVVRYPGIDLRDSIGYTAGNPFDLPTLLELKSRNISLIHSHCPVMSNLISRTLRESMDVPFIMTYHTKFDIDIANTIKLKGMQHGAVRALVDSVSSCDELWVVSDGAGKNITQMGYEGDYIVMPNGVDMPKHRVPETERLNVISGYDLPEDIPVFLFVGRLMWYKGLRIILDALAALRSQDMDFRMVFVGGGGDEAEVKAYVEELSLGDRVIFTGAIHERERLAAWYCSADLLLFPSTFDTNGLVVREAAACSLGAVLVKGSCAAEGVKNGRNALLIDENAASLAVCLARIMENREAMRTIGQLASEELYYSWHDAVDTALERYEIVIDNYACGKYEKHHKFTDRFFSFYGDLLDAFSSADKLRHTLEVRHERYL